MSEILIALCFPHEKLNIDHIYEKEEFLQTKHTILVVGRVS